jgi:hypothetical protein
VLGPLPVETHHHDQALHGGGFQLLCGPELPGHSIHGEKESRFQMDEFQMLPGPPVRAAIRPAVPKMGSTHAKDWWRIVTLASVSGYAHHPGDQLVNCHWPTPHYFRFAHSSAQHLGELCYLCFSHSREDNPCFTCLKIVYPKIACGEDT